MYNDVFAKITEEDLTPDLRMISDACGIDSVKGLLREFGGMSFYIPKITRLDKFILKYLDENNEKSLKQIAKELNVSEQFLKNMKFKK
jgi:hypothetical protein